MRETPRTDKILSEQAFTDLDGAVDVLNQWVDFARRLERERNGLAAEVLRLKTMLPDDYARADMESREP